MLCQPFNQYISRSLVFPNLPRPLQAANDGGLTLLEYSKYLVLLKGDYQCSPGTMNHVIKKSCAVQVRTPPLPVMCDSDKYPSPPSRPLPASVRLS